VPKRARERKPASPASSPQSPYTRIR
jgi:hypothetical protein